MMRVVVLAGGLSAERDVSLSSGKAVLEGIQKAGHEAILIDPALGGDQHLGSDFTEIKKLPPSVEQLGQLPASKNGELTVEARRAFAGFDPDVVFNALHGGDGENGKIQALLDLFGIRYTGSGVLASALAMDKALSKTLFRQQAVGTADWILVRSGWSAEAETAIDRLGYPVVVKPNDQGSSVALTIVHGRDDLHGAVDHAAAFGDVLVEKYVPGRELTVAILDGKALPVVEIKPKKGVYDYEAKYTPGMTTYESPARLTPEQTKSIQDQAMKAYETLRCECYARVDFRMGTDERFYCLEVNTLPGMTATSLVPKAAKASGIEFPELLDRILKLALDKNL